MDIIEIGGADHATAYRDKIFRDIKFSLPLIVGSDNHNAQAYSVSSPCWIKADPTFDGLRMAIREPEGRFWLGDLPPAADKLAKNRTRYMKKISFTKAASMPGGEQWLTGEVPLNPGLVAIIGNKGSGKSALSDCLGLLGSCGTSEAFSFLDDTRFRSPKSGRAQHVMATLHWHDGEPRTRSLIERVAPDEPERVKYLPQNFVEKVCNDLAAPGGGEFERELKKVVFSKVSVRAFLEEVVRHLHTDTRPGFGGQVLLKNQIGKGKSAADLYAWLYGLGYLKPRYLLRWDGKDVAQLSPGERGTLLLIFYLLIDDSDMPLIIDQPEANLDNVTVAQKLVDCIRDARDRRQVVIVTHNPNLAVVCDADQIIHATLDKPGGNKISYQTGALESPAMNRFAIDVLEGGRSPFDKRDDTYRVAGE